VKERTEERKILKKAEDLIKAKDFNGAIRELSKYPLKSVEYYLLLAQAYEGAGNLEKAESFFEKARFLETEIRSKELLQRGINLALMRNFKAAERELLSSLKLNPFDKEVYLELYKLYKKTNNFRKMVKTLEELITLEPYFLFPYLELGRHYLLRKRYKKAEEILKEGISRIESAELHFELGKVYSEQGRNEEAKEELKRACRLDFKNIDYRQKLTEVLVNAQEYEEALDVVLGTLNLYPEAVYVLQSAAALYDLLGNQELAEYYYRKAVAVSEGFVKEDAQKLFSEFLIEKGRYDQAEEVLWELLKESDNVWILIDAFSELATILIEQERLKDIIEAGKIVLSNPELSEEEFVEVGEIVADALFEEKRFKEAGELYKDILKVCKSGKVGKRIAKKLKETEEIEELNKMLL